MTKQGKFLPTICKLIFFFPHRYIRYIRTCTENEKTYTTAAVWAEMKKTVEYRTDVIIDKHGVITECQCECAVGQGPTAHCKHIATTLFAVTKFCESGELITEMTCTQVSYINSSQSILLFFLNSRSKHKRF